MITKTDNKMDITEILGVDGSSEHMGLDPSTDCNGRFGVIVAVIVIRLYRQRSAGPV
jgi:hypothetical protein